MIGRRTDLERPTLQAAEFIRLACGLTEFGGEHLASRAQDRETATRRRLIATFGVERWRQKGTALASVLDKSPDVVSWRFGEGVRRRLEDDGFAERIDRLDEDLSTCRGF